MSVYRSALLLLLLLSGAGCAACDGGDGLSSSLCESPCYTGPKKTDGVGACTPGHPVCVDGVVVSCEGEVLPSAEACDGVDNDCDGKTDEYVASGHIGRPCDTPTGLITNFYSQCRTGYYVCSHGVEVCEGAVGPSEEVCDGVDNDCDDQVDEGLTALAVCYDGAPTDLASANVACRAGVTSCVRGELVCVGQVLPSSEVCDRQDNDCNGTVDDIPLVSGPRKTDVALLIDVSGSMTEKLEALGQALAVVLRQYGGPEYHYAVIFVPGREDGISELIRDFGEAANILPVVTSLIVGTGSWETSYDAILAAVDKARDLNFDLSWRKDAVHVVAFFGDEEAQSARGYTERDVRDGMVDSGAIFYGFVMNTPSASHVDEYDDIASATGGEVFDLTTSATSLTEALTQVVQNGCAP